MGEIADMMLDGTLCEGCGEYIGSDAGYPQYCSDECAAGRGQDQGPLPYITLDLPAGVKIKCTCGKMVKARGFMDHWRDKHP